MDAKQLEAELGRGEAIAHFVAEAEVVLSQLAPELNYRRPDLQGFVRAAWPCDGTPADVAVEFANELVKQEE
jgi:hypothetical protein